MEWSEISVELTAFLIVTGKVILLLFGICMILVLILAAVFLTGLNIREIKTGKTAKRDKTVNRVILMGRLTQDPDIRWTQGQDQRCIARFTLAVDRRQAKKEGQQNADFISCVSFGKTAEFIDKYIHKGTKIVTSGRIQTGSYTNRDGQKVYTTDVICEDVEFAESKAAAGGNTGKGQESQNGSRQQTQEQPDAEGFMDIPDGIEDELPFS